MEGPGVWDYFGRKRDGIFVDVGANHPVIKNQTFFLECKGWTGILIEPNPALCDLLRTQRIRSRTFQVAVCGPGEEGQAELHLAVEHTKSSLTPEWDHAMTGERIGVSTRTIDSILAEVGFDRIDVVSLDVEGMELAALRGLSLEKYQPALILLEDHFYDHQKHTYLKAWGYKLVKRTGYNNWYVPQSASASLFSMSSIFEILRLWKKMWLNMPFNHIRRRMKQRKRADS